LSTTFLFYYQSFLFSAPLFCGAEDILALTDPFGKHYFIIFVFYFGFLFQRETRSSPQANMKLIDTY